MEKISRGTIIKAKELVITAATKIIDTPTLCIMGMRCDCAHNGGECRGTPEPEYLPCMGTVCKSYRQRVV